MAVIGLAQHAAEFMHVDAQQPPSRCKTQTREKGTQVADFNKKRSLLL